MVSIIMVTRESIAWKSFYRTFLFTVPNQPEVFHLEVLGWGEGGRNALSRER